MELSSVLGAWVAAGLTLFLFSFLYRDNPFYRAAEHFYVGVGTAWMVQLYTYSAIIPKVYKPLIETYRAGDWFHMWLVIIPAVLGLSLITQFIPKISWISRYGFTFLMGYGAGLTLPAGLATDFMNQIVGTIEPFASFFSLSAMGMINAIIILIGTLSVLCYFFF
jgi:hypothetical protein